MSKRLLTLNAVLVGASIGLLAYIGWHLFTPIRDDAGTRRAAAPTATPTAPARTTSDGSSGAYGAIASRNLFSPERTEAPVGASAASALAAIPKPNLFGVILKDGAPVAYLEDPITKRVAGYRVGDAVAGGTLQSISADRVVLTRPEGQVDVRLHDPSRPRPPAPPVPGQAEGIPGAPGTPGVPGMPRPPFPSVQQPFPIPQPFPAAPPVAQPQMQPDQQGQQPGRRPLPPNLLRRIPPGMPDVPTR